jgi:putative transposase
MLLAHKVRLYPTAEQAEYLRRCMGARRFAYNALLARFKEPGIKWSRKAAYDHFINHVRQPWMLELTSRAPRNAIDDLHNAFQHFFRRCKTGEKPGFPKFHKKGVNDSFAIREKPKFDVCGRLLRIEKAPSRIKMQRALRWTGVLCSVTISERAGKFYAAVMVDTQDYDKSVGNGSVGVDFGVNSLAALSTGEILPANQALKANLRRLKGSVSPRTTKRWRSHSSWVPRGFRTRAVVPPSFRVEHESRVLDLANSHGVTRDRGKIGGERAEAVEGKPSSVHLAAACAIRHSTRACTAAREHERAGRGDDGSA